MPIYNRTQAKRIVTIFEQFVEASVMAGAGNPYLIDWKRERMAIARERMIRRLSGDSRPTDPMPPRPETRHDQG